MRALPVRVDADPVEGVRAWLDEGRTALKGAVMIDPGRHRGRIIWPIRLDLV